MCDFQGDFGDQVGIAPFGKREITKIDTCHLTQRSSLSIPSAETTTASAICFCRCSSTVCSQSRSRVDISIRVYATGPISTKHRDGRYQAWNNKWVYLWINRARERVPLHSARNKSSNRTPSPRTVLLAVSVLFIRPYVRCSLIYSCLVPTSVFVTDEGDLRPVV